MPDYSIPTTDTSIVVRRDEIDHELSLTEQAERSLLERLTAMKDSAEVFVRRTELIEACYLAALRRTRPEDWILSKDNAGAEVGMLADSGASLVAEMYGVVIKNIRPTDDKGLFAPEKLMRADAYGYRGACDGFARFNGRSLEGIEAARWSDEDFTGRSVDKDDHLVKGRRPDDGAALESDLRMSTLTSLRTKAVRILCGMSRVPVSDLRKSWAGTDKKVENARKGSGYGSGSERGAAAVTSAETKSEAAKLGEEIVRRVGGDLAAAAQLTQDITSDKEKGFKGFDTVTRLTQDWQVKKAWAKLKAHPVFGDAADRDGKEGGGGR